MAITTWANVKSVLELSTTKQTIVEALIPFVEDDYKNIRNKDFDLVTKLQVTAGASAGGDLTVTIDEFDYTIAVENGDSVQTVVWKIAYGLRSVFRKLSVDGDTIYFDDLPMITTHRGLRGTIQNEKSFFFTHNYPPINAVEVSFNGGTTGAAATVTSHYTHYPPGAEMTAIQMIQFQLNTKKYVGAVSESLGDHSITYDRGGASLYPPSITKSIKRYVSFV